MQGRIVYNRPKHEFHLADIIRIARHIDLSRESEENAITFIREIGRLYKQIWDLNINRFTNPWEVIRDSLEDILGVIRLWWGLVKLLGETFVNYFKSVVNGSLE